MGRSGLRGSARSGNTATEDFHLIFIKLCSVCLILASNRPKQQANAEEIKTHLQHVLSKAQVRQSYMLIFGEPAVSYVTVP